MAEWSGVECEGEECVTDGSGPSPETSVYSGGSPSVFCPYSVVSDTVRLSPFDAQPVAPRKLKDEHETKPGERPRGRSLPGSEALTLE